MATGRPGACVFLSLLPSCLGIYFLGLMNPKVPGEDSDWPGLGHITSPVAGKTQ